MITQEWVQAAQGQLQVQEQVLSQKTSQMEALSASARVRKLGFLSVYC